MEIKENYSLKHLNTFGLDVKARYFAEVSSKEELRSLLSTYKLKNENKFILGGGSNILFTQDFDGLVFTINNSNIEIVNEDKDHAYVKASAGAIWHDLVLFSVEHNLGGIENLSLIPGKTGGAPIQNIGAYGQELKDTFYSLSGIYFDTLEEEIFYKNDCEFAYRSSVFKKDLKGKFIITDVTLKLDKHPKLNTSYGSIEEELSKKNIQNISIKDVSEAVCEIRRSKLPDPAVIGNAGSFFKNPEIEGAHFKNIKEKYPDIIGYPLENGNVKVPAGWLIEKAGLKGKRQGETGTHPKQALVIVNYGNASGKEIIEFKDKVKQTINDLFDIDLEEEVNIL